MANYSVNVDEGQGIKRYANELLKLNIDKRVIIVLNFAGNFPPEKRTFTGRIIDVGIDFFILNEDITRNQLLAYFVNLAYLSFIEYPNLPGKPAPEQKEKNRPMFPNIPIQPVPPTQPVPTNSHYPHINQPMPPHPTGPWWWGY